jgi:hypothetical protein
MKNRMKLGFSSVLLTLACACDKAIDDPVAADGTPTKPVMAIQPSLDQALDAAKIKVNLEVVGQPREAGNGDATSFVVRIQNLGTEPLSPAGKYPVNLGVSIATPDGKIVDRNFGRRAISAILPGTSEEVTVELAAAQFQGRVAVIGLVQEGVAWFADIGQPSLTLVPFPECAGRPGKVCAATTKP